MTAFKTIVSKKWKRIMLKLSGEVLVGTQKYGIDPDKVSAISKDIKRCLQITAFS